LKVHLLPGSYTNIKITTPEDMALATLFLQQKEAG
jgi:2-C-methyl-D-erythritol 4-phosphate cytidylyltransferase